MRIHFDAKCGRTSLAALEINGGPPLRNKSNAKRRQAAALQTGGPKGRPYKEAQPFGFAQGKRDDNVKYKV
jgi:hypothetical protein